MCVQCHKPTLKQAKQVRSVFVNMQAPVNNTELTHLLSFFNSFSLRPFQFTMNTPESSPEPQQQQIDPQEAHFVDFLTQRPGVPPVDIARQALSHRGDNLHRICFTFILTL